MIGQHSDGRAKALNAAKILRMTGGMSISSWAWFDGYGQLSASLARAIIYLG